MLIVLIVAIVEHGDAFGYCDIDDDIDEVDNDRRYLGGPGSVLKGARCSKRSEGCFWYFGSTSLSILLMITTRACQFHIIGAGHLGDQLVHIEPLRAPRGDQLVLQT